MTQVSSNIPTDVQTMKDKKDKQLHAIAEMEKHLSVAADGTIVLKVKSAADIQVDETAFNDLTQSLDALNQLLKKGLVQPSQVRLKTEMTAPLVEQSSVRLSGSCAGQDYFGVYWWGMSLWVDECTVQEIEAALGMGSGVAAITAAILAAVPAAGQIPAAIAGVVAGILQVGAAFLQWVDGQGGNRGVVISITWLFVIGWISHQ